MLLVSSQITPEKLLYGLEGKSMGLSYSWSYVRGLNPGCGTIVGGVFHPTRQVARFSLLNMPYNENCKFIYN